MQSTDDNESRSLPSCVGCRTRKLKCSRETPSCTNCRRLESSCVYDSQRTKPGVKRGTVEKLSKRIDSIERKLDSWNDAPDESLDQGLQQSTPAQHMSLETTALTALTSEVQRLASSISHLSQAIPFLPQVSPQGTAQEGVETRNAKRRKVDAQSRIFSVLDTPDSAHLSDFQVSGYLDSLPEAYFANVHPWIPMIHRATFMQKIQDAENRHRYELLLYAMLVGTSNYDVHNREPVERAGKDVEHARNHVMLAANQGLAIENLQALIIVAFTHIGDGELSKAWPIVASLTRLAEFLHLSVEEDDDAAAASDWFLAPPPLSPPSSWVEDEERRRVFWNIFILDRLCSITTGWTVGLTADNSSRRLPICGTYWNENLPGVAPYFGIWDKSAAKISNSVAFLPAHYSSPKQAADADREGNDVASEHGHPTTAHIDMKTVGAFAHFVESLESLCRINMYFLRQKINFDNRQEVSNWLTRFKELDLRLVHWKMFLPPKWKDPSVPPPETADILDPNMSLAHVTHNTSMILLHQRIGYPEPKLRNIKLPNFYSAETCQSAAIETSNITKNYLSHSTTCKPLSPHWAFCAFVSAKALLVHHRFYCIELSPHFGVLVECLEEMADRWVGNQSNQSKSSIARHFAHELERLHKQLEEDPTFVIKVVGPLNGYSPGSQEDRPDRPEVSNSGAANGGKDLYQDLQALRDARMSNMSSFGYSSVPTNGQTTTTVRASVERGRAADWNSPDSRASIGSKGADELSNILMSFANEDFMGMDRVISLEDLTFEGIG